MGLPLQQSYINNTYQLPTPQILHPPLLGTPQILHPYPAENVGVTPQILHPPPNMQHRSAPTTTIVTYLRVCVGSSVTANPTPMHYQRGVRGVPKRHLGRSRSPCPLGQIVGRVTQRPVLPCDCIARCCCPMQALHDAHGTNCILSLKRGSDGQDRVPRKDLKCV